MIKTIISLWIFVMSVMYFGIFVMGEHSKPARQIIKQTTHATGINLVYSEGKDTFAFDGLTAQQYDSIFSNPPTYIKAKFVCPDCGEWGCIYEDIDERIIEGTDAEISAAIYQVCKERHITDSTAIAWLKGDYYQ